MDSYHYICDILYYNTGTWWIFDDGTIIIYSGYPDNSYDIFQRWMIKRGETVYNDWIRYNSVNLIHKKDILESSLFFCTGESVFKYIEII